MVGLGSLTRSLISKVNEKRGRVALLELNSDDTPTDKPFVFQYFPETITDTDTVNYQTKDIFGASLPLYQYGGGGARTITFTAVFSSDLDLGDDDIISNFDDPRLLERNVDIRTAITTLRSYRLPKYTQGKTIPPPKLLLNIQNSGIGIAGGDSVGGRDSILCIMTQCEVTYEAFFPTNIPRVATVNLAFNQVAQYRGGVYFPQVGSSMKEIKAGTKGSGTLPYSIRFDAKFDDLIKKK